MNPVLALFLLMRPRQWTKNLVVFAGLVFSVNFFDPEPLLYSLQAFAVFCLAAGAVYTFNDLYDRERDRHHPVKKKRPLASGAVSVEWAGLFDIVLLTAALGWAFALSKPFGVTVLGYVMLNLIYTLGIKRAVILDVMFISAGFVLRAVAGAVVIRVEISPWLLAVATLLSLFLGFAKRRHELVTMGDKAARHRVSLGEYSPELLDQYLSVVAAATIMAYSLYAFTSPTARQHHYLMLTVPLVIYGIMRYLYLVYQRNLGGSPELVLLKDKPLIAAILLWVLTVGFILQGG